MEHPRRSVTILQLLEKGLVKKGDVWRIDHRTGEKTKGTITSKGTLKVGSQEFTSPSAAATASLGGTPINGWVMWKFQEDGEWKHIGVLRDAYFRLGKPS